MENKFDLLSDSDFRAVIINILCKKHGLTYKKAEKIALEHTRNLLARKNAEILFRH